jgi:hypothetical protein
MTHKLSGKDRTYALGGELGSKAAAGELLIGESPAQSAELGTSKLDKLTVELKGKSEPMDVWIMQL